ncbi:hypothetical protein AB9E34_33260, partial [Rhizobium leguminosarum]|uniref:hypothetical protein n=1 Tax=Rhizobium leguminosarum TaxID=384 RepID=UPI003F9B5E56
MIANLHLERQCLRTSDPLDTGPKTGAGIGDAITFNVNPLFTQTCGLASPMRCGGVAAASKTNRPPFPFSMGAEGRLMAKAARSS